MIHRVEQCIISIYVLKERHTICVKGGWVYVMKVGGFSGSQGVRGPEGVPGAVEPKHP